MTDKTQKDIHDFLMDAKRIVFLTPDKTELVPLPTVFLIFENLPTAGALYSEAMRVNKEKKQFFGFQKSSSSLILSFILKDSGRHHAKMLLDYDESEFDNFVATVNPTSQYLVLFGKYGEDGSRQIASPDLETQSFLTFDEYSILN